MLAELPSIVVTLDVKYIDIDGFSYSFAEASLHGYDPQQSSDAHVYLIVHEIEPPPAPLGRWHTNCDAPVVSAVAQGRLERHAASGEPTPLRAGTERAVTSALIRYGTPPK